MFVDCAGCGPEPACVRGRGRYEFFSTDPVEVVFEGFKRLPEGFHIVEWDLDGSVVDIAEDVHLVVLPMLWLPGCGGGLVEGRVREKLRSPRLIRRIGCSPARFCRCRFSQHT